MTTRGGFDEGRIAGLAGVVVALLVAVGLAGPAGGQEPPPTDLVTIEDGFGVAGLTFRDCDGVEETDAGFASVFLRRRGTLSGEATVGVAFSGDEADNLVAPPTEVTFAEGDEFGYVDVSLATPRPGTLTVTLSDGPGATVLPPASIDVEVTEAQVGQDCLAPILVPGEAEQTIEVGEQPGGFFPVERLTGFDLPCYGVMVDFADGSGGFGVCVEAPDAEAATGPLFALLETPPVGALPPGLSYADDTWTGAATTPGTYPFQVRFCEDVSADRSTSGLHVVDASGREDLGARAARRGRAGSRADAADLSCFGTADVSVTVLAGAEAAPAPGTTGPAPAAQPISTAARFTG